jgi:hypothetical protein
MSTRSLFRPTLAVLLVLACGLACAGGAGERPRAKRSGGGAAAGNVCTEREKSCRNGDIVVCLNGRWELDYDCSFDEPCVDNELNDPMCVGG